MNPQAMSGTLVLIAILVLLALLLQKEVTGASADSRLQVLSRVLNVGIVPLVLAFTLIVVYKVIEVLN